MDTRELRRLLSEATAGDWVYYDTPGVRWDDPRACGYDSREPSRRAPYYCTGPKCPTSEQAEADARLIAALHNAAPALLDVVEAAEAMPPCKCRVEDGEAVQCRLCAMDDTAWRRAVGAALLQLRSRLEALHGK